jgi:hypothetical protein
VEVAESGQVTKDPSILKLSNLVLLEVQFCEFRQIALDKNVMQILAQLLRGIVGKCICQMQLHEINEIGKYSRVVTIVLVVVSRYAQIIVIQNQSPYIRNVMITFAAYFSYVIIAHVYNCQII